MSGFHIKYKERSPKDTLDLITGKLDEAGIKVSEEWTDSGVQACHSMRLCIEGTQVGSNGKGTTPEFARASGYAEFMERLQNSLVYTGTLNSRLAESTGFWLAQDEKLLSVREMAGMDNPYIDRYLDAVSDMPDGMRLSREQALKRWAFGNAPGVGYDFIALPFFSLSKRQVYYMPYSILRSVYGSNGMCAGNTPEEALVQGLSEIFERYVNMKIIVDGIVPPEIPDEYLAQFPEPFAILQEIRQKENFRISVRDCSLGEGFPVVCTVLFNTAQQSYFIKFGAHPSFGVAFERTLTEILQGKTLNALKKELIFNWGDPSVAYRDNLVNIIKTGSGAYPTKLYYDEPSYAFTPFPAVTGKTNSDLLMEMCKKITDRGLDILVRDVSFMGFPSYFVLVPGFSEVYYYDDLRIKDRTTLDSVSHSLRNLHTASEQEIERVLRYMKFKKFSVFENTLKFLYGLPLQPSFGGSLYPEKYLEALLNIRLSKYEDALKCVAEAIGLMERLHDREHSGLIFLRCLRDSVWARVDGADMQKAKALLAKFYEDEVLEKVTDLLSDTRTVLDKGFPAVNCWDCERCESKNSCSYDVASDFLIKVAKVANANPLRQEDLNGILPVL